MIRTEIYIENYGLDLSEDISTEFTYAVDDITDFGSKNTSFSKTINLVGSPNNNKAFGFVFDLGNANFTDDNLPNVNYNFNATKSAQCRIFVDKIQIFKGSLRILSVTIAKGVVNYEVSVFGELGGLMTTIGNGRLEDLDFSAYNHVWNTTNIQASWDTAGSGEGYFYPLIDYGLESANKVDFRVSAFRPALYVKQYIDKIFEMSGYSFTSDFMDTPFFKRLIIPHNQKQLSTISSTQLSASPVVQTYQASGTAFRFAFSSLQLGNFTWEAGSNQFRYNGGTAITTDLTLQVNGNYSQGSGIAYLRLYKNGTEIGNYYLGSAYIYHYFQATISLSNVSFTTNDVLYLAYETNFGGAYTLQVFGGSLDLSTTSTQNVPISYGETIIMSSAVPKGIFQKDFLISICKMFNLYLYDDKWDDKKIYIKPYIDFYDTNIANALDWSSKIDREQPLVIEPMSQMTARYYHYKHKEDSDFYNENYRKRYNQSYGDFIFDSDIEFSKETEELEIMFAGSYLFQQTGTDKKYTAIYKLSDNNTKEDKMDSVIRILQCKKITGVSSWAIKNALGTSDIVTGLTSYGYAGHLDDPDNPSNDINFGAPKEIGIAVSTYPTTNVFNAYHSPLMAEMTDKNSKLLTCDAYLTQNDINNLDFSKLIFIDGFLFRLVKVDGYTPLQHKTTRLTLLKVIETQY